MVIFLLALTIAFPFIGVDMLHATSIFIISLGLNERDGLAILIGIAAAIASLVLVTGVRFSARRFASNLHVVVAPSRSALWTEIAGFHSPKVQPTLDTSH